MALHTLSQNALATTAFAPAALANSTQNGASIDTQGLNYAPYRRGCFLVSLNPGAATTANFQVQDSPDNSTWTNVSGATLAAAVAASTSALQMVDVDLSKRQRYLRIQIIGTGAAGAASSEFVAFEGNISAPTQASTPILV